MTQDEIIEMAKQAGFEDLAKWTLRYPKDTKQWCERMEAFAKLVAAKEREECALLAATPVGTIAKAIRARGEA